MENYTIGYETEHYLYSHTLTKNPQFQPFDMHAHNQYELLFIINGDAKYTIEGNTFPIHSGDLIIIKPRLYHTIHFPEATTYERFNVYFNKLPFNKAVVDEVFSKHGKVNVATSVPFSRQWSERMDEVITTYSDADKAEAMQHLISELLFWLKYNLESFLSLTDYSNNTVLTAIIKYINENLGSIGSVADIAQNNFISEPYLFHLFKKHLNTTPKNYIMQKKMLQAERLIKNGEKLKNVCQKVGYTDYSVFFKAYKKYFGKNPSE